MGEIEYCLGCKIRCDLTNMNLNVYQPHIITKITQGFDKDLISLMNFNTPDTLHKGVVRNQDIETNIP